MSTNLQCKAAHKIVNTPEKLNTFPVSHSYAGGSGCMFVQSCQFWYSFFLRSTVQVSTPWDDASSVSHIEKWSLLFSVGIVSSSEMVCMSGIFLLCFMFVSQKEQFWCKMIHIVSLWQLFWKWIGIINHLFLPWLWSKPPPQWFFLP